MNRKLALHQEQAGLMTRPGQVDRRRIITHGLGAIVALSQAGPAAAAARLGAAALKAPATELQTLQLANGLQAYLLPDRAGAATVAVQLWYRVGGKDDPPGRSGFAHLFEHMMFKATRHMAAETFDRLTEDVGGINNAFTAEDVTVYQSEVPSNHLERLLWAEAERMGSLRVDAANFASERKVVQEELRQRVLADPYGRLFNALAPSFWQQHPYRRPVIGSIEDLDAATLDDVQRFHATYYRPDNALLIIAGDFDADRARTWVQRYFGVLDAPAEPVPRVNVREPRRTRDERVDLRAPRVPLPAVALLWQGPPAAHADAAPLKIASALLSGGDSARLNARLVYRDRVAQSAGFSTDLLADGGMLAAWAIAAGRGGAQAGDAAALAALEAALVREVAALARGPVRPAELETVRARLLTAALGERETAAGRAAALGWALVQRGDARAADSELAELQAVTAADVQRVLRRYVLQAHRVSLRYTAAPAGEGQP